MTTFQPGDVVVALFSGVRVDKNRPAVVVSSDLYHATRPDVVLAVLTKNVGSAVGPADYVLQDWQAANLRFPSAFRPFFDTFENHRPYRIGRLSDRDWAEVQARLRLAIAI